MNKFIAASLLSLAIASPSFAEDAPAKAPAKKPDSQAQRPHGTMHPKSACDDAHGAPHHGYGMMGGHGTGMMVEPDMHMLGGLNLSKEQHGKITKLADELQHDNWARQGTINDETAKLRDLYQADTRDPAAIGQEYQKLFDAKRQMIEAYLTTQNRIEEVLTAEQRAKLKEMRNDMRHLYLHSQ